MTEAERQAWNAAVASGDEARIEQLQTVLLDGVNRRIMDDDPNYRKGRVEGMSDLFDQDARDAEDVARTDLLDAIASGQVAYPVTFSPDAWDSFVHVIHALDDLVVEVTTATGERHEGEMHVAPDGRMTIVPQPPAEATPIGLRVDDLRALHVL